MGNTHTSQFQTTSCRFVSDSELHLAELEEKINRLNIQVAKELSIKEELQKKLKDSKPKVKRADIVLAGKEAKSWAETYFQPNSSTFHCTPANIKD